MNPSTVHTMAMPGYRVTHGADLMNLMPPDKIMPQSGRGSWAPRPRKPIEVVDRIADGSASEAMITMVEVRLGSTYLTMMDRSVSP